MRTCLTVALLGMACMMAGPPARAADLAHGEKVFNRCKACHTLSASGRQRQGPSLYGLFGREAGTAPGYDRYSTALKSSGIVWTEETLEAFLADPRGTVPGNTMAFAALRKADDRADLVAYLKDATE